MSTAQYTSLGTSEDITGDIFVPRNEDEGTTLDEPVTETLVSSVLSTSWEGPASLYIYLFI